MGKASAPPKTADCTDVVLFDKSKTTAETEKEFNAVYEELAGKGKTWQDLSTEDRKAVIQGLPNPGKTIYNKFHAAMAQNSTIPDEERKDASHLLVSVDTSVATATATTTTILIPSLLHAST